MNHEKRSITRTESQGKGRGITIKVVSLKPRPLDTQLIVIITQARQIPSQVSLPIDSACASPTSRPHRTTFSQPPRRQATSVWLLQCH